MRASKFTESQAAAILIEGGDCIPAGELCPKHGMSNKAFIL